MAKLESGITLTSIVDGSTINGYIKVLNTPLIQRYTKGGKNFVPDFEALSDTKKPVVAVILRDGMSGDIMVPNAITFKYNGVALGFGEDGLCNTVGFQGVFKRILNHPVPMGADAAPVNMTVLQVVKNLVPLSGYDNDTISAEGTVEVEGQSMEFAEVSTPVVIQESTGNQYDLIISDDNGGFIDKTNPKLTLTAAILRDSVNVDDLQGFTFKWYKMAASGDALMGSTNNKQAVTKDDVDDSLLIRCEAYQGDGLIASGYKQVKDYSDTYYVQWNCVDGNNVSAGWQSIRKGQVRKLTPVAISREDNSETQFPEVTYKTIDNKGNDFTLTGKDAATFTNKSTDKPDGVAVTITYNDCKRAGHGIHLRMSGVV